MRDDRKRAAPLDLGGERRLRDGIGRGEGPVHVSRMWQGNPAGSKRGGTPRLPNRVMAGFVPPVPGERSETQAPYAAALIRLIQRSIAQPCVSKDGRPRGSSRRFAPPHQEVERACGVWFPASAGRRQFSFARRPLRTPPA